MLEAKSGGFGHGTLFVDAIFGPGSDRVGRRHLTIGPQRDDGRNARITQRLEGCAFERGLFTAGQDAGLDPREIANAAQLGGAVHDEEIVPGRGTATASALFAQASAISPRHDASCDLSSTCDAPRDAAP